MMQTSSPADSQGEQGGINVGLFLLLAETGGKGGGNSTILYQKFLL